MSAALNQADELERLRAELRAVTEAAGYFPPSQTLAERVAELREQTEKVTYLREEIRDLRGSLEEAEDDLAEAQNRLEQAEYALRTIKAEIKEDARR